MNTTTGRQHSGHPPAGQAESVSEVPVLATPARRLSNATKYAYQLAADGQPMGLAIHNAASAFALPRGRLVAYLRERKRAKEEWDERRREAGGMWWNQ